MAICFISYPFIDSFRSVSLGGLARFHLIHLSHLLRTLANEVGVIEIFMYTADIKTGYHTCMTGTIMQIVMEEKESITTCTSNRTPRKKCSTYDHLLFLMTPTRDEVGSLPDLEKKIATNETGF